MLNAQDAKRLADGDTSLQEKIQDAISDILKDIEQQANDGKYSLKTYKYDFGEYELYWNPLSSFQMEIIQGLQRLGYKVTHQIDCSQLVDIYLFIEWHGNKTLSAEDAYEITSDIEKRQERQIHDAVENILWFVEQQANDGKYSLRIYKYDFDLSTPPTGQYSDFQKGIIDQIKGLGYLVSHYGLPDDPYLLIEWK